MNTTKTIRFTCCNTIERISITLDEINKLVCNNKNCKCYGQTEYAQVAVVGC